MRVSADRNDSGYRVDCYAYDAFLDGVRVDLCVTADEEAVVVICHERGADGKVKLGEGNVRLRVVKRGVVKIRRIAKTRPA